MGLGLGLEYSHLSPACRGRVRVRVRAFPPACHVRVRVRGRGFTPAGRVRVRVKACTPACRKQVGELRGARGKARRREKAARKDADNHGLLVQRTPSRPLWRHHGEYLQAEARASAASGSARAIPTGGSAATAQCIAHRPNVYNVPRRGGLRRVRVRGFRPACRVRVRVRAFTPACRVKVGELRGARGKARRREKARKDADNHGLLLLQVQRTPSRPLWRHHGEYLQPEARASAASGPARANPPEGALPSPNV